MAFRILRNLEKGEISQKKKAIFDMKQILVMMKVVVTTGDSSWRCKHHPDMTK